MTRPRLHPALTAAATAAIEAWHHARGQHDRHALIEPIREGADGTATSLIDDLVESAVLRAVAQFGVDVLSEEIGHVDNGSDIVLLIDPVDGTGNAAAGIPFSAFTAAIAVDGLFTQALTHWFEADRRWVGSIDEPPSRRTSQRSSLDGGLVSMIRPKHDPRAFLAIAKRAGRTRVLGSSAIEAALVADGVLDAAVDPGSRTHRIVDLAAAVVLVEGAGGVVTDVHGGPVAFTYDITSRWSGVCAATAELAAQVIDTIEAAERA